MMQAVPQVLKKINDSDWSALSVVLRENEKILMVGVDTDYTYYKALSPTNQNTINKMIKDNTEFRDFAVFRTAFVGAVNQSKENRGDVYKRQQRWC